MAQVKRNLLRLWVHISIRRVLAITIFPVSLERKLLIPIRRQILTGHSNHVQNLHGSRVEMWILLVTLRLQSLVILQRQITRNITTSSFPSVNIRDSICLRVWPKYKNRSQFNMSLKNHIIIIRLTKCISVMVTNQILWVSSRRMRHLLQVSTMLLSSSRYPIKAWKITPRHNTGSLISMTNMRRLATKEWSNTSTWEKLKGQVLICQLITSIRVWPEHLRDGPYQKWTEDCSRRIHTSRRDLWNIAQILLSSKRRKLSSKCPKLQETSPFPSMVQPIRNSCLKASSDRSNTSTYPENIKEIPSSTKKNESDLKEKR